MPSGVGEKTKRQGDDWIVLVSGLQKLLPPVAAPRNPAKEMR